MEQTMSFDEAIRRCLANFANFEGRASRPEFWYFALAVTVAGLIVGVLDAAVIGYNLLSFLFNLAVTLPSLAVGARRLHDTGRSGWWQAPVILGIFAPITATAFGHQLGLISVVCTIPALAFCAMNGTSAPNQYGDPPNAGASAPTDSGNLSSSSSSTHPVKPSAAAEPKEPPAAPTPALDLLSKLAELRDQGVLTTEEFEAKKASILKTLG
jgi:uncharacterized membrane protein YhaH (DUF805 family)